MIKPIIQEPMELRTHDVRQGTYHLDRFGVTVHKCFISAKEVRQLKKRLEEQADMERQHNVATIFSNNEYKSEIGKSDYLPNHQRVPHLVNKGREFIDLAKHPIALAYASHVLHQLPFNVSAQAGIIIRRGAPAQVIHNDQQFMPFTTPIPLSLNVMVALSDYTEEMGATRVIPGSHLGPSPNLSSTSEMMYAIPVVMEPGDAAIWESRVWHGQGAAHSEITRLSIATMYAIHFLKPADCHPALIHEDVYAALSDEERALFGFDYTTYLGRIGPRHPTDQYANVNDKIPFVPLLFRQH